MSLREIAQALGRRGGQARARRLSAEERTRIAALGAEARLRSLEAARRVAENFLYADAVLELQGGRPAVARVSSFTGPLPGAYSEKS